MSVTFNIVTRHLEVAVVSQFICGQIEYGMCLEFKTFLSNKVGIRTVHNSLEVNERHPFPFAGASSVLLTICEFTFSNSCGLNTLFLVYTQTSHENRLCIFLFLYWYSSTYYKINMNLSVLHNGINNSILWRRGKMRCSLLVNIPQLRYTSSQLTISSTTVQKCGGLRVSGGNWVACHEIELNNMNLGIKWS